MERHVNPEDPDLYALGALDGEEKQAFEAHVRRCTQCAGELAAAQQRAALVGLAAEPAEAPAPRVKAQLMQRARSERAQEIARRGAPGTPARRRNWWLTPALAVATVVFAALAGWFWMQDSLDMQRVRVLENQLALAQSQSRDLARAAQETGHLLGMPGTMRVSLAPMPGMPAGRAGLLYNARMGMVLCTGEMPPAPNGKIYQLWLVPMKGAPMTVNVFPAMGRGQTLMGRVAPGVEAKAFAVTVEPGQGMPQPTGPKVLMGAAG
jgi:anti-sigma-K factor RskA